jgi:hypothetical protein
MNDVLTEVSVMIDGEGTLPAAATFSVRGLRAGSDMM